MGTKMGPSYACLFMGHLEHLVQQSFTGPMPELYKRFIDDGIGAGSHSESVLLDFIHCVQNFHSSIKFTYKISPVSVEFLDMSVAIKHGQFATSVFYKRTDAHSYLYFDSSRHPNTKASIPCSQFLRLRRLCSDDEDFLLLLFFFFSEIMELFFHFFFFFSQVQHTS